MIIRRDTLNAISELKSKINPGVYYCGRAEMYIANSIARALNLAAADVADAIKAFKL